MDCRLYEPGDEIVYLDHPNLTMVPLNDAARRRLQAEIDHQTSCQREKAMRDGRQFSGLITDRGVLIADADQGSAAGCDQRADRHADRQGQEHAADAAHGTEAWYWASSQHRQGRDTSEADFSTGAGCAAGWYRLCAE